MSGCGDSPAAILFDRNGNPVLVTADTDGAVQLSVVDTTQNDLLRQILSELRKLNFMLAHATDVHIDKDGDELP